MEVETGVATRYKRAKIFSSGTELENFKHSFCKKCYRHLERDDGFPMLLEDGGCPIEDGIECARFDERLFPNVLVESYDDNGNVLSWHCCPFFSDMTEWEGFF